MCGIIGAVSTRDITAILIEGLKRLEYRGYDSAGLALLSKDETLHRVRVEGKVNALVSAVDEAKAEGSLGIAHTRWATHGKPSERNAHPHISHEELALVHNGIIENHDALRHELIQKGYVFKSETDTEVAAHLIHHYYQQEKNLLQAVRKAANRMTGAYALGVIHQHRFDELIAVRLGSPLVIGIGEGEYFIASDPMALQGVVSSVIYCEEGDLVHLTLKGYQLYDVDGKKVQRDCFPLSGTSEAISKDPYPHFMLKEIHEQPAVLSDTIEGRAASLEVLRASFGDKAQSIFKNIAEIHIIACGTSYHAGLVARYWLESLTGLPTHVDIASEYRYRDNIVPKNTLFVAVSQSGETADTLAALYKAKSMNYLATLAICNVATSTLVREVDCVFLTRAGVEIGVASTKAFTTQLTAFLMLALALSQKDDIAPVILSELRELPALASHVLALNDAIEALVPLFVHKDHALFLGRGVQYPVALEGALKLKEISYIHAEGYPAGELKHGPLALVDDMMPVVALAPRDRLSDKLKSNLHEITARGGELIIFGDEAHDWRPADAHWVSMPACAEWIAPIVYTIPLQLLAYHVAVAKGTDVDQPRNLAKSVTVE